MLLPVLAGCATTSDPATRAPAAAATPPPASTPALVGLSGKTWQWERTLHNDGRTVVPTASERYTIAFQDDGKVNLRADCNRGTGPYAINGNAIKMGPFATTKMLCPAGSSDGEFLRDLERADDFRFGRGQLALSLTSGGLMRFSPQP